MSTIQQLFDRYGESHRNPINKSIHWVCVPLITFSLLGMLWAASPWLALAFAIGAVGFYLRLSFSIAVGMLAIAAGALLLLYRAPQAYVLWAALGVFVLAWIGQFIGHRIEGKKPSFFEDLKFLLIGPIWLLGFVYRKLGIAYD